MYLLRKKVEHYLLAGVEGHLPIATKYTYSQNLNEHLLYKTFLHDLE